MSVTTLLNTDRPLGDFALERDIIWQPCPLRWSLPRGRNALVHHTSEVVRALCLLQHFSFFVFLFSFFFIFSFFFFFLFFFLCRNSTSVSTSDSVNVNVDGE